MLAGVLAGVLNANFALAAVLPGRSLRGSAISDLSAAGQPWSWAFRVGDGASGLLLLVVAVAGLRRCPEREGSGVRAAWRAGLLLVALSAVTTAVSALVPLSCPATATSHCPGAAPGSVPPLANQLHDTVSVAGTTAALLAGGVLVLVTVGATRLGHLLATLAASGLGVALVVAAGVLPTPGWFGSVQQAQVVVLSAWFAVVGRSVDDSARPGSPAGARAAAAPG